MSLGHDSWPQAGSALRLTAQNFPVDRCDLDLVPVECAQDFDDFLIIAAVGDTERSPVFQDQVEIGVRFVPLAVGAEATSAAPKEPVATSGSAYLRVKVAQVQERERRCAAAMEAARAMHAILKRLATASRFDAETADRDWIAAAFLMPRDATETFQQAVCRLAKAHPKLALLCTGPWPPYSLSVARPTREQLRRTNMAISWRCTSASARR